MPRVVAERAPPDSAGCVEGRGLHSGSYFSPAGADTRFSVWTLLQAEPEPAGLTGILRPSCRKSFFRARNACCLTHVFLSVRTPDPASDDLPKTAYLFPASLSVQKSAKWTNISKQSALADCFDRIESVPTALFLTFLLELFQLALDGVDSLVHRFLE